MGFDRPISLHFHRRFILEYKEMGTWRRVGSALVTSWDLTRGLGFMCALLKFCVLRFEPNAL